MWATTFKWAVGGGCWLLISGGWGWAYAVAWAVGLVVDDGSVDISADISGRLFWCADIFSVDVFLTLFLRVTRPSI